MSFLFSSQNVFAQYCSSASAPLVGELGDFKPGTSCCSTVPARDAYPMTYNKMIYFMPIVSSGQACAISTYIQEIPPPRIKSLLRGSKEKPLSHLILSTNVKTYNKLF